jgi:dienelactone hydrolase
MTPGTAPAAQPPASPQTPPNTQEPAKPVEPNKPGTTPPDNKGGFVRGPEPTAESATKAGPYKVGQISMGFRNGPNFGGATIYYPQDAEPPFAMIVFCPGFLGTQASDRPWGPFMASHGIVFMNIDTNTTSDSVMQRQAAEQDALLTLQAEHTREGSPLNGKLANDRYSYMGWSMGGGGAWLNANAKPEIKSIITLAGHNSTAGGALPLSRINVPTLMLAGTADTAVLGLAMSQPVYDVIPEETPKMLYEVEGASHFDFNDPAYMNGIPARFALSWQKVFLEGDMRYYKFLMEKGPMASDFRTNLQPK